MSAVCTCVPSVHVLAVRLCYVPGGHVHHLCMRVRCGCYVLGCLAYGFAMGMWVSPGRSCSDWGLVTMRVTALSATCLCARSVRAYCDFCLWACCPVHISFVWNKRAHALCVGMLLSIFLHGSYATCLCARSVQECCDIMFQRTQQLSVSHACARALCRHVATFSVLGRSLFTISRFISVHTSNSKFTLSGHWLYSVWYLACSYVHPPGSTEIIQYRPWIPNDLLHMSTLAWSLIPTGHLRYPLCNLPVRASCTSIISTTCIHMVGSLNVWYDPFSVCACLISTLDNGKIKWFTPKKYFVASVLLVAAVTMGLNIQSWSHLWPLRVIRQQNKGCSVVPCKNDVGSMWFLKLRLSASLLWGGMRWNAGFHWGRN